MTEMFEGPGPRVNVPLLRKTLEAVEDEAAKVQGSQWDQRVWRCGTGMCFAGWAVHLDGGEFASDQEGSIFFDEVIVDTGLDGEVDRRRAVFPVDDIKPGVVHTEDVPTRAMQILGLTEDQAYPLFAGGNNIDNIRSMVGRLIDNAE